MLKKYFDMQETVITKYNFIQKSSQEAWIDYLRL